MQWFKVSMRQALAFCRGKELLDPRANRKHIPDVPEADHENYSEHDTVEVFTDGTAVAIKSALKYEDYESGNYVFLNDPICYIYDTKRPT